MKNACYLSRQLFFLALSLLSINCTSGNVVDEKYSAIPDTAGFLDSAHHWYDINDEEKIIEPDSDQRKYSSSEITKIADNILLFQKSNGGWPKNYDMQAVLSEEQKDAVLETKNILNTTFDNGATHSQLIYLANTYTITGEEKYKEAFLKGIEFVLEAQYENGGWPQFYPDNKGYRRYITFNDGAMIGIMDLLQKIVYHNKNFLFIENDLLKKIENAYIKGVECILNCQINEKGILTAWCQQHGEVDCSPVSARSFEPAAICNGESSGIVKFLMSVKSPDKRIITAVKSAVKWFEDSKIYGIRVEQIKVSRADFIYHSTEYDNIVVEDPAAPPVWTRFYELSTHRPMFCNRDGKVVYSLAEVERERRTGYAWYVYDPQEVLDIYKQWLQKIE